VRSCLLLVTVAGCETSNAVITGTPVGGQAAGPAGIAASTSSSTVAGRTGSLSGAAAPAKSGGSGGMGGGSVMPPPGTATGGTPSAMPAATAGTSGAVAQAGMAGGASGSVESPSGEKDCRTSKYSLAVRLTFDVRWDETLGLMAGAAKAYLWSKLTIDPSASMISEFRMCGGLLPVYHSTAVAGNIKVFQRVPQATFDLPTMPMLAGGSVTRIDSGLALDPGTMLVGLTLPDPAGAWPASSTDPNVMAVDADGDGRPAVTSLMRNDTMFTGSPTSILQTERIDANYVASRVGYRATLNGAACTDTLEGPAELLKYDTLVIGCHVKDRNDCTPEEVKFVEENRPKFMFSSDAVAQARVIPVDATCAQALEVLDVPGP
jgi:hypothetical protein